MKNKNLHRFSVFLVLSTFILIFSGGLVTSKGVGMSVPDWPTTYGYNMFLFPISMWVGGIFHEHLHRLIASAVGLLTVILCVWLFISEPRRWFRRLGVVAVVAVCIQGLLGGLRVNLMKDQIGIFHGCLAQSFLLLTAFMALATSSWWKNARLSNDSARHFTKAALFITLVIFINTAVAATMRHAHAGLSIPDFPAAYGQVIPPMDAASVEKINETRISQNLPETSSTLIALQFTHRLIAYFLAIAIPWLSWKLIKAGGVLKPWAYLWTGLVVVQIALGAWTIWSNKAADVATAHVATGAVLFIMSGLFTIVCYRAAFDARSAAHEQKNQPSPELEPQPELLEISR